MDPSACDDLVLRLFQRLRDEGVPLGIAELLAARQALAAGLADDEEAGLGRTLRLLWCASAAQNAELDNLLHQLIAEQEAAGAGEPEAPSEPEPVQPQPPEAPPPREVPPQPLVPEGRPAPGVMPLPVRAPEAPATTGGEDALVLHAPVSRRAMAYTWRYLRRPVKDGPCDWLDLDATVERSARQGYFDRPVLTRRTTDHGRLILLVDQGGSMVPFHRLTRDLVQTANDSALRVDIGWFQNVPAENIYRDPHRTRSLPLALLLTDCTPETSVLLVSDAGAARGGLMPRRFQTTARVLVRLKQHTGMVAWLNPVPAPRWPGSTAALIAAVVPMFPMDEDGFGNAVDVLRGQVPGGRP